MPLLKELFEEAKKDGLKNSRSGLHIGRNKWGCFRLVRLKHERSRKGYLWAYHFNVGGERVRIVASNLLLLRDKVINKGYPWIVTDEDLFRKAVESDGLDYNLF